MKSYKDRELLMKAIDDYDVMRPSTIKVLKTIVALVGADYSITIFIRKLCKLSKVSVPMVYVALETLEQMGFIRRTKYTGTPSTTITIEPQKLEGIMEYQERVKTMALNEE